MNQSFFVVRAGFYFLVWGVLAWLMTRKPREMGKKEPIGGVGLILLLLTMTFASVDWSMSLEPKFHSSIYGLVILVGQALTGLTFTIIAAWAYARKHTEAELFAAKRFQQLGNMLLAVVMLWGYMSYFQVLIIWSGNIAQQVEWYVHRTEHGWMYAAFVMVSLQLGLPLVALLFRKIKCNAQYLAALAGIILLGHVVEIFWLILPSFRHQTGTLGWMDFLLIPGMGAILIAYFLYELRKRDFLIREKL